MYSVTYCIKNENFKKDGKGMLEDTLKRLEPGDVAGWAID